MEAENYCLKVQIFSTSKIDERSGKSEKTGRDWFIRTQEGYIDLGGQFPVQVKIPLTRDQIPYAAGHYYVHPSSFRVNGYFDLQVGDLVLVPFAD